MACGLSISLVLALLFPGYDSTPGHIPRARIPCGRARRVGREPRSYTAAPSDGTIGILSGRQINTEVSLEHVSKGVERCLFRHSESHSTNRSTS